MEKKSQRKKQRPKRVLIKISGDLARQKKFFKFATDLAKNCHVVVVCGAGKKINTAFKKMGYKISFGPQGRITKTDKQRDLVLRVLRRERRIMENRFIGKGVKVVSPIMDIGGFQCHIDGDDFAKHAYLGFDEIFVMTLRKRVEKKKEIFKEYPKIKIIGL